MEGGKKRPPAVPSRMHRPPSTEALFGPGSPPRPSKDPHSQPASPAPQPQSPQQPQKTNPPKLLDEADGGDEGNGGSTVDSTPREEFLGQFQLGKVIGKGGFGTVHKGLNLNTGEMVAIKRFSSQKITRANLAAVMGEAELLTKLDSDRIVKFYGYVKTKMYLYFVLEYVEEGALSGMISSFGTLSEKLAAIYVEQVLQGLAYLHSQHVVHRDIKGSNILITKGGSVKLADFGVSAIINESEKRYSVVGTPYWMAPEVIEMSGHSVMSDIWSVGCLIAELITGEPPYFSSPPMAAMFRIVSEDHPDLPSKISPDLEDFLLKCWQKDPSKRPTAEELMAHPWIKSAKAQTPGPTTPKKAPQINEEQPKKKQDSIHEVNSIRATIHLREGEEEDIHASDDSPMATDTVNLRSASIDCTADALFSTDSIRINSPSIDRRNGAATSDDEYSDDSSGGSHSPADSMRSTSSLRKEKASTIGNNGTSSSTASFSQKSINLKGGSERTLRLSDKHSYANTMQIPSSSRPTQQQSQPQQQQQHPDGPDPIQSTLWKKLENTLQHKMRLERELEAVKVDAEELRAERDDLSIRMIEMKNKNEEIMTLAKACLDFKASHHHHDSSSQDKQHEKLRKRLSQLLKESETKTIRKKGARKSSFLSDAFHINPTDSRKTKTLGHSPGRLAAEELAKMNQKRQRGGAGGPADPVNVTINPLLGGIKPSTTPGSSPNPKSN